MNKEELIKQFDEKLQQLRDEFIAKLEDDKKEFKLTYPEKDYWVYCVDGDTGKIVEVYYTANNTTDRFLFEHGYYFETKEEAEQYLKERKLLFKIHQWANLKNEGWEPNWSNSDERKYYIYCSYSNNQLKVDWSMSVKFFKLPYFKTKKIAQECIDLFGDEIKEVLC